MSDRIPFVDREKELSHIEEFIHKQGVKRILWIQGPGGSGKTRLLEEVEQRFGHLTEKNYVLSPIIDFDDRALHITENFDRLIAQWLGEQPYKQYLREVLDRQKMEEAGVSEEMLTRQSDHVSRWLIDTFNQFTKTKRAILLIDTVEKVEDKVWTHLCDLFKGAKNTFILLVSRRNDNLWDSLKSKVGKDAELVKWEPLEDEKFGEMYLEQKQRSLHIALGPAVCEKLILLVGGRPILIDLTVEAVSRNLTPEILINKTYSEIKILAKRKGGRLRKDFEIQLVRRIMDMRDSMDRLVLVMSRVYPMSSDMLTEFLNIGNEEAKTLFNEAKGKTIIKTLPDGRITLHDEIRTMVENYVWPYIDPEEDRQKRDSRVAVEYFVRREAEIQKEIQEIEAQQAAKKLDTSEDFLQLLTKNETLKQQLWDIREQFLVHSLYIDKKQGVRSFAEIFDKATRAYHFPYREVLLRKVDAYMETFSPEMKYEVNSRKVKAFLDTGDYEKAEALTSQILRHRSLSVEQRVDMLIQYGNIKIRLGRLTEGKDSFEKAVRMCRRNNFPHGLVPSLNARGWGYRLVGNIEKAIADYQEALELSFHTRDELRRAWILNNLAFVYSQQGRYNPALALCAQAHGLWEKISFGRGLGAVYEVYGSIYIKMERYDEAEEYFQKALEEFNVRDVEWLSRIHAGLGLVYRMKGDREGAMRELNLALEYDIAKDRATILHRLAHIQLEGGSYKRAKKIFEQSYQASREISDAYHELNNLGDLAMIAVVEKDFSSLAQFEKKYRDYKIVWPDMTYARVEGMILKHMGDLALGANSNNISKPLAFYEKAFVLLAQYETYKEYTVQRQLELLDIYMKKLMLSKASKEKIGQALYSVWQKNKLAEQHPEALGFFAHWMEASK
jgi:tetratricopeptide (TPR) repeat protein